MALPSPDDYDDWKLYIKSLLGALDSGAIAEMISRDPYASSVVASAGIGTGVEAGYSPVWLSDDDANLYLGSTLGPPTAGALFNVDTQNLADVAVTFGKIADGAVGTNHVQALAITTALIADAAVLTAKIGDAQIVNAKIADLAVNTAKIANLAVSSAKIANLAAGTAQIDNLAVTTGKIALLAVDTAQINAAAISTAKIGALQVDTANIAAGAITNAKIGALAVDTAQINAAAITAAKIGALAVGTAAIDTLAVTKVKIGDYVIDASKLEQYAVTEYDLLEATGVQAMSGAYAQLNLSGTPVQVSVTTPNITGDMSVILLAQLFIDCSSAGAQGYARFTVGATAISYFNTPRSFDNAQESLVMFDTVSGLAPNTTYTFQVRVLGDTNIDVFDAVVFALLLKR